METEIVRDAAALLEFEPEWTRFADRISPPTPFQTPEWLATWWRHFGSGELRVLVFRRGREIAGVLPCFLHQWNGRRQLTLIGSGMSDYLDPLFEPGSADEIVPLIGAQLRMWADWDLCAWQDLSHETALAALGAVADEIPCSAIALGSSFEEFLTARPKDLRRNLRRYKEKAESVGSVTFEVRESADREPMDALIRLHRARWERTGSAGMIESNHAEAFVRAAAQRMAERGWLRIFIVRFDAGIAAVLLALCNRTTIFSWLSAFDPEHEKFGFGRELLAQAIRYAHERGKRSWNFLRGDEAYKFSWGAVPIPKCRVIIRP